MDLEGFGELSAGDAEALAGLLEFSGGHGLAKPHSWPVGGLKVICGVMGRPGAKAAQRASQGLHLIILCRIRY